MALERPIRLLSTTGALLLSLPALTGCAQYSLTRAEIAWRMGRHEEAIEHASAYLSRHPDSSRALLVSGRALANMERCPEAVPVLERAAALDPEGGWRFAWAQVELGRCRFSAGEPLAAEEAFEAALASAATENVIRAAGRELGRLGLHDDYDSWRRIESDHFVFRFSPGFPEGPLEPYVRGREQAWTFVTEALGGAPDRKIDFFFWGSDAEAQVLLWRGLGFALPREGIIHSRWNQTRGHELTHIVVGQVFQPEHTTKLINEGIAVYLDHRRVDRLAVARQAMAEGAPFRIVAQWRAPTVEQDAFYPVAGAFVERLAQRGGMERLRELLRDQRHIRALELYGADLPVWIAEFEADLAGGEAR